MRVAWVVTGGFDRSGREHVTPMRLTEAARVAVRPEPCDLVRAAHRDHRARLRIDRDLQRGVLLRPDHLWQLGAADADTRFSAADPRSGVIG